MLRHIFGRLVHFKLPHALSICYQIKLYPTSHLISFFTKKIHLYQSQSFWSSRFPFSCPYSDNKMQCSSLQGAFPCLVYNIKATCVLKLIQEESTINTCHFLWKNLFHFIALLLPLLLLPQILLSSFNPQPFFRVMILPINIPLLYTFSK